MSLTQLTDKIIKDAEEKKNSILSSAKNYALKKEDRTKNLSKSMRDNFEKELEEKLLQNINKVTHHAKKTVKNLVDKTKRDELNSVFEESLAQLKNSSDEQYEKILSSLFETLPKSIDGTLLVKPKHFSITKKILNEKGISCVIKEDSETEDGFVIKGLTFEYNGTFKKLLQEKKEEIEVEVAKVLFN